MLGEANAVAASPSPRVKASLVLGAESFVISPESGRLSVGAELAAMKEKSMAILNLKEYIAKHNAANDVPDESVEGKSDGEGEARSNPPKKSKKQK